MCSNFNEFIKKENRKVLKRRGCYSSYEIMILLSYAKANAMSWSTYNFGEFLIGQIDSLKKE